ncbi:nuclear transport factor 2 family protein [Prauserella flavalba]|uniref:nuclear transport factor 2 family protein n=1 Tax=Prauserella flavalba TaxID=1477506 RepID=UPI0036EB6C8B
MVTDDARATAVAAELLARYCWAIDDEAYDDLRALFLPEAVADYGVFRCRGGAEVATVMAELHRGLRTTQHLLGSVSARADDDGRLHVRSHVRATLVARSTGEEGPARVEVAASYRDLLMHTDPGWRIAERRVDGRWVAGDRTILPWFDRAPRSDRAAGAAQARGT